MIGRWLNVLVRLSINGVMSMTNSALAVVAMSLLLFACLEEKKSNYDKFAKAEVLYADNCSKCHGASGGGNFWLGKPANANTHLGQRQIADLIMQGRSVDGKEVMPAFTQLDRVDALFLAEYVLVLKKRRQGDSPFWEKSPMSKKGR